MKRNHRSIPGLMASLAIAMAACSSATDTGTNNGGDGGGTPSISVSLSASSLTIARGGNGSVTATVARTGGFTGDVAITVEGLPSGVTASADPSSIGSSATTSSVTATASDQATAGTTTITIRASGSGVTAVTATFSLIVTVPSTGSFTIALSPTSLSVQQGGQGTATVDLTRTGGFTGAVALSVGGAPTGVTATLDPTSTTSGSSTLTVAVATSVAAGSYTLTITGTATGIADQTASLSLTVTASGSGSGNVTYTFCPASGLPAWVAYQDGSGAWTRVTGNANNEYSFNIGSGRGGVAWVTTDGSGGSTVVISYASQQELTTYGNGQCSASTAPTKTINGSVANVGATETANIYFNGGSAVASQQQGSFTLKNVIDGPGDLVAGLSSTTTNGASLVTALDRIILRRGINPADGSTLPVLDFNAEGFTPVTKNITVNGLSAGDNSVLSVSYFTGGGAAGLLYSETLDATNGTRQYYGVPSANQAAGDLHVVIASGIRLSGTVTSYRSVISVFKDVADKTVTLGPALTSLAVSTVGTARLAFTYPIQSEYKEYWVFGGGQTVGNQEKSVVAYFTAGYMGSSTAFDYAIPDFTSVAGWNTAWDFTSGTPVGWYFDASGSTGGSGIFGTPYAEGVVTQSAVAGGAITP